MSEEGKTSAKLRVAEEVRAACEEHGMFYVKGHGIPDELQAAAFKASQDFFSLPSEVKEALPCVTGGFTRGYIGVGKESGSDRHELKEAFSYGYEWDSSTPPINPLQGPNLWPPSSSGLASAWQEPLQKIFTDNVRVGSMLTGALALSLGEEEAAMHTLCQEGDTISLMRLFHYLPLPNRREDVQGLDAAGGKEVTGSSPHTDWGWITIILQDPSVVALEVFHREAWHPVPPQPGTLLVNVGDYVSLYTRGRYVSPLHRVISPPKERFSFVFFAYPGYEARIPQVEGGQRYSLFTDQLQGGGGEFAEEESESFGRFILDKWAQVRARDLGHTGRDLVHMGRDIGHTGHDIGLMGCGMGHTGRDLAPHDTGGTGRDLGSTERDSKLGWA
eukprot:CAMPEP_0177711906 /NCGR_PEP_ID=MMETSP0484_2-20121128/12112_1 /TAXON_ID=354590 /ORGANISM="Rhodomonas lens, Strain RHODO" /LENGTH=387 /DNA_ID=CAMNT_0019223673 /DNA_START=358 /DNA_END=1522 /DNA_ORIENTATION=+